MVTYIAHYVLFDICLMVSYTISHNIVMEKITLHKSCEKTLAFPIHLILNLYWKMYLFGHNENFESVLRVRLVQMFNIILVIKFR